MFLLVFFRRWVWPGGSAGPDIREGAWLDREKKAVL